MFEILVFIVGLFIGSFLGVVIDRTYRKETTIKGRSYCDKCKKELAWYDLIPVLSFVFLKGRCRYCKTKLSLFYPITEISTGILFALVFYFFKTENPINIAYYLIILSSFIVIFFQDIKYGIIPDKIIFPAMIISIFYLFINNPSSLILHLASGIGAFFFFLIISYAFFALTKKQGMGGGDIKLAALLGIFLGFPKILICLYLAFLTGAIVAIILILWRKKFLKDSLPFGPFLIFGTFISLFLGDLIYPNVLKLLGI